MATSYSTFVMWQFFYFASFGTCPWWLEWSLNRFKRWKSRNRRYPPNKSNTFVLSISDRAFNSSLTPFLFFFVSPLNIRSRLFEFNRVEGCVFASGRHGGREIKLQKQKIRGRKWFKKKRTDREAKTLVKRRPYTATLSYSYNVLNCGNI